MPKDEEMYDADIHIHSTPESRRSDVIPRPGNSRGRDVSPNRPPRLVNRPSVPRSRVSDEGLPERVEISTPPALRFLINQVVLSRKS